MLKTKFRFLGLFQEENYNKKYNNYKGEYKMDNEVIIERKDESKGKIILFAIGVLVGAVVATGAFLVCVNTLGTNNSGGQSMQMQGGGTPPEMPSGDSSQGGTPPEMPSGQSGNSSQNGQSSSSSSGSSSSNSNSNSGSSGQSQ